MKRFGIILLLFLAFFGSAPAGDIAIVDKIGLVYASYGARQLKLDFCRPDNGKVLPGLITVHGGGWLGGSRDTWTPIAKRLAAEGYAVANIEYRLAGEEKFPGAVFDCKAAVQWLRSNAKSLAVNPDRIGGIGGSAGGHLIAMAGMTADGKEIPNTELYPGISPGLQALIIMGSGVDQVARVLETPNKSDGNCVLFLGAEYRDNPEIYRLASPINHINKSTPPILMLDGEKDKPGERYVEFRRRLDRAGIPNRLSIVSGAAHGDWGKEPYLTDFVEEMVKFLRIIWK